MKLSEQLLANQQYKDSAKEGVQYKSHILILQIQLPDLMSAFWGYADPKKIHKSRSHDRPDYSQARFDCHSLLMDTQLYKHWKPQ